jgi:crossover junction endodeoxyribonuclease RusA
MSVTGEPGRAYEWTLNLAYTHPPLSLNYRLNRFREAALKAQARVHAKNLAMRAGIPRLERFTAVLHYQPRGNQRRDTDNLIATLKPLVDGLIDAHVAVDDSPRYYTLTEPVIHRAKKGEPGRMWLVVVDLSHTPGTQIPIAL